MYIDIIHEIMTKHPASLLITCNKKFKTWPPSSYQAYQLRTPNVPSGFYLIVQIWRYWVDMPNNGTNYQSLNINFKGLKDSHVILSLAQSGIESSFPEESFFRLQ